MTSETPIIGLEKITLIYKNGKYIFKDLSFPFCKGQFYILKGASGIGKTSLFRLITRLEEPTNGELRFKGVSYSRYYPPELRKKILYIHQTPLSIEGSVKENLLFPFSYKNNRQREIPDAETLQTYLQTFRLADVSLEDNAKNLSVGQLQRICFVRGLLLDPEVILLDEPTSALDEESSKIVEQSAENFCLENNKTVIMISHKTFEPASIRPIYLQLENGKIEKG